MKKVETPWAAEQSVLLRELASDPFKGLSSAEAEERLSEAGENKITHSKKLSFWDILLEEIREPMILMLLAVGVLYSIWGDIGDTVVIIFVILAVALVEVYTEYKAKKSMETLKKLALPTTWVLRDGRPFEIETSLVVPGDILILKSGVRISADARVLDSHGLEADESQLTGESCGVRKTASPIARDAGLCDRVNMVHMGSVILKGSGRAVVSASGMDTELGRIAGLTEEAREPKTPLQKSMKQLSKTLIWAAVFFSVFVPVVNILRNLPLQWDTAREMLLTGLSFAFATIPEEMPIIITMALGLGAARLSKQNVLLRHAKAAETLGSVSVIATDKTGTLTQNKMAIENYYAGDEKLLFTLGALMADVTQDAEGGFLGDPMDKSVLEKAGRLNIDRKELLEQYVPVKEYGFDEKAKTFMSLFRHDGELVRVIKGAPESVFSLSHPDGAMEDALKKALQSGLRTVAFACKWEKDDLFKLAGLICFGDPVRADVPEAIARCAEAGVRVLMITGDHVSTAKRVAENAGIQVGGALTGDELSRLSREELADAVRTCNVFARISPEQKLSIVEALREGGEIVAVTGDGINDAPALKSADIGVAMGLTGTDVAKEAADMILTDDSFASIVSAIEEGRRLFDNLSKCVKYYLACKVGLILSFLIPTLINIPLPFSPIQIIIMELFMDLAASTSFVSEKAEADLLRRPPRDTKESFMNRKMLTGILGGGATLAICVLAVYLFTYYGTGAALAQTYAFITWLFGHVALAFHMRTDNVPLLKAGIFASRAFNLWMAGVASFLVAALNIPALREYLHLESVSLPAVLCLALIAFTAALWMEIRKIWHNK